MKFSQHVLTPFGVEINKEAIDQAKTIILPTYSKNFIFGDVNEYNFDQGPFDIIITNPYYGRPNAKEYIQKCYQNLNPNGMILLRIHSDVLERNNIKSAKDIKLGHDLNVIYSSGGKIEYGRIFK